MDESDPLAVFAKRLDEVPSLHEVFGADPQLVWMPLAEDPKKRNLFVGLFITEEALTRAALASMCSRTITELNTAKAFAGAAGLEINVCVARGETAEPVLRLKVQAKALANAELLTAEDLAKKQPGEGITCSLYRRVVS